MHGPGGRIMTKTRRTREVPLILASASDRRRRILAGLGVEFAVVVPKADEIMHVSDPARTVRENAAAKNEWCRERHGSCRIISADTVIDFDGRTVTKPSSIAEAKVFFEMFSGRRHKVLTAVALYDPGSASATRVMESSVLFRQLDESTVSEYFSRVNPLDKAGGYDIDQAGELVIASFSGSRTNIMGLPRELVSEWLAGLQPPAR
jgi:septum formation protein